MLAMKSVAAAKWGVHEMNQATQFTVHAHMTESYIAVGLAVGIFSLLSCIYVDAPAAIYNLVCL